MMAARSGTPALFRRHGVGLLRLCGLFFVGCIAHAASSPPIDRHLTIWTAKDGAPAMVMTIAQTADGWLWFGGPTGLFRFDGVRFERYAEPAAPLPANGISILATEPSGALWIGYRFGGASRLADGKLRNYDERDGLPKNIAVWGLEHDGAGRMWAATARGMFYLQADRWHAAGSDWALGIAHEKTLMRDRHGVLWVQGDAGIYTLAPGANRFARMPVDSGIGVVTEVPDGSVWSWDAGHNRLRRLTPPATAPARQWRLHGEVGTLLFDRDGNLWAGRDDGIEYHSVQGIARTDALQGLSAGAVSALFEDRDGSIWAATVSGIDRFRRKRVARVPVPETLSSQTLAADDAGGIWTGRFHIARPARDAAAAAPLWPASPEVWQDLVSSSYRDAAGILWTGAFDGLWRADGTQVQRVALPAGVTGGQFNAIAHDRTGGLWISLAMQGVFRRDPAGSWSRQDRRDGLPDEPARTMAVADNRDLWLGYPRGRLLQQGAAGWRSYGPADGLGLGMVMALHAHGDHLWAGGENGLALRQGNRFITLTGADGQAFSGLTGIVELAGGDLWLNAVSGLFRIPAAEIAGIDAGKAHKVRYERLDDGDGVDGNAPLLLPSPSIVQASDGYLWLATTMGIYRLNPAARPPPRPAPPVLIRKIGPLAARSGIRLAPGSAALQIEYTAIALARPERVRFRYRLDGIDAGWQDAGRRRTAYYNSLGAGHYRFRVQASNDEGQWGTDASSIDFSIAPIAFETWWFKLLCVLAVLAATWLAYRWRVRRHVAHLADRLEERTSERERIARELHDTLLQSVQGLILHVHAAVLYLPGQQPARVLLDKALAHADDVLHEGRDRVRDLRAHEDCTQSLDAALEEAAARLRPPAGACMQLTVTGKDRALRPAMQHEILAIACEALANIYRHAEAGNIAVTLAYRPNALCMTIGDDGCGIPPAILAAGGRAGHWGMSGMRERAARIGARLTVDSRPAAGTHWTLAVPGALAYRRQRFRFRGSRD